MKIFHYKFQLLIFVLCLSLVTGLGPTINKAFAQTEGIAAVVNDEAISFSDVSARMRLIMSSSGIPNNPEIRERLVPQILNTLIDERLKLQEAAKNNLAVSDEEIERGFANIAQQNNLDVNQFRQLLGREGIPISTLQDQIRAQIAWSKVVQSTMRSRIDIASNEINAVMDRMKSKVGKTEYRVFEIFLPVTDPQQETNVRQLAERLHGELRTQKVPFQRVASQFSQSPGAAQKGGDLGWVQEGQLTEVLDTALQEMQKGQLTMPVRSLSGYHILLLADKRQITEDTMPSTFQIEQDMGNERLDLMQRRHLIDMKSEAFIEKRNL